MVLSSGSKTVSVRLLAACHHGFGMVVLVVHFGDDIDGGLGQFFLTRKP